MSTRVGNDRENKQRTVALLLVVLTLLGYTALYTLRWCPSVVTGVTERRARLVRLAVPSDTDPASMYINKSDGQSQAIPLKKHGTRSIPQPPPGKTAPVLSGPRLNLAPAELHNNAGQTIDREQKFDSVPVSFDSSPISSAPVSNSDLSRSNLQTSTSGATTSFPTSPQQSPVYSASPGTVPAGTIKSPVNASTPESSTLVLLVAGALVVVTIQRFHRRRLVR